MKAQLPALNFLMIISVAAAVLFIVNIWRRGWVLPVIAVGLWGFISIVVGTIYPAYIQRFEVKPNEFTKEQPYIERNITATRFAFGIDHIKIAELLLQGEPHRRGHQDEPADARQRSAVGSRSAASRTSSRTRSSGPYFTFSDLDLDRYPVGDEKLEVEIAIRELNSGAAPELHVAEPASRLHARLRRGRGRGQRASTPTRRPTTCSPTSRRRGDLELEVTQPNVYYGEDLSGFTVVNSKQAENQPTASQNDSTIRYKGTGGVVASSFLRKAALALSFGSWDLFISQAGRFALARHVPARRPRPRAEGRAVPEARRRPVRGRHRRPAGVGASTRYTTTNRYPYSQSLHPERPARHAAGSTARSTTCATR